MSVGKFKAQFSKVLKWVKKGKKVAVTFGRNKEIVGYFIPKSSLPDKKRTLGIMEGKAEVGFREDFKMTEVEFLKS